jgi:dihydroflavonol-4-reductase
MAEPLQILNNPGLSCKKQSGGQFAMLTDMSETVLVTGGSGFVASHLIEQLLDGGARVHATVRSVANAAKMRPLDDLNSRYPEQLRVFEADLLQDGSFTGPMQGCSLVFHVASPFMLPEKIKDGRRQMLEPALRGTQNVLASVNATETVRRVVFTSTVGAIFGDYLDVMSMPRRTLTEDHFNSTSSLTHNPYHYSKVMAEKEAWSIAERQNRWSLVSINPGLILGPSLSPASESGSLFLLDEMLRGMFFYGMPDMGVTTVDVRDVALAHIRVANTPSAKGRYILADARMVSFLEMAKMLRAVHRHPYLLPKRQIPGWLVKMVGPLFGLSQEYMRNHIGIRFAVDNRRSIEELGIVYRPLEETLKDHYASWLEQRRRAA